MHEPTETDKSKSALEDSADLVLSNRGSRVQTQHRRLETLISTVLAVAMVHCLIAFNGGVVAYELLYSEWFGLSLGGVKEGKLWQLISYGLLHGGWFHLATNIILLCLIGRRLLEIVTSVRFISVLIISSIGGGLLFVLFEVLLEADQLLVGLSGGVFGLLSLYAAIHPYQRVFWLPVSVKNLCIGVGITSLWFCLIDPRLGLPFFSNMGELVESLGFGVVFRISHACHLGGLITGAFLIPVALGKLMTSAEILRQRID